MRILRTAASFEEQIILFLLVIHSTNRIPLIARRSVLPYRSPPEFDSAMLTLNSNIAIFVVVYQSQNEIELQAAKPFLFADSWRLLGETTES